MALFTVQKIYVSPLILIETFIFIFDLAVALYYLYHIPLLDRIKQHFVYYQYRVDSKPQGLTGFIIKLVFLIFTKLICVIINLFFMNRAQTEIEDVKGSHDFTAEDQDAFKKLEKVQKLGDSILVLLLIHVLLFVISLVVAYLTRDDALREYTDITYKI